MVARHRSETSPPCYYKDGDIEGLKTEARGKFLIDFQITAEEFRNLAKTALPIVW